jgi:hypothetical protein
VPSHAAVPLPPPPTWLKSPSLVTPAPLPPHGTSTHTRAQGKQCSTHILMNGKHRSKRTQGPVSAHLSCEHAAVAPARIFNIQAIIRRHIHCC